MTSLILNSVTLSIFLVSIFHLKSIEFFRESQRKLIQALLDKCRSKKIKLVRMMIDERDNELQSFFKRQGFDRGRTIDYSKTV
jgi:hypothetical protein